MPQRDYILRMIEQLGAMLARMRQMILGGASKEAVRDELQAAARSAGVDFEMARLVSADTLLAMMSAGAEIEPTRCWATAELLFLDGLDHETSGQRDAALASYEKARRLFRLLEPAGAFLVGWPEASERIEEIDARMTDLADGTA